MERLIQWFGLVFMDSKFCHCSNNLRTILQPGFKLIPKSIISLLQCCRHLLFGNVSCNDIKMAESQLK